MKYTKFAARFKSYTCRVSKKRKEPAAPPAPPAAAAWPALPALALAAFAGAELWLSLRHHNFPRAAEAVQPRAMAALMWATAAAAPRRAWPAFRHRLAANLDAAGARRAWSLALAFAAIFSHLSFVKWCQFRACALPLDSAATLNLAFNALKLGRLESSVLGVSNYFAVHFMPGLYLLAPLAPLGAAGLIVLQCALLASAPIAVYRLAERRAGSALAGWAALWLVFSSAAFGGLTVAHLAWQTGLAAFFLWTVDLLEDGRPRAALIPAALALASIEQAPLMLLGVALWAAKTAEPGAARRKQALGAAAFLCALAAGELLLKRSLAADCGEACRVGADFAHLSSPAGLLSAFWPPAKLAPLLRLLASTAFACLLAPWELAAAGLNLLPHVLSWHDSVYHSLGLHYAAYAAPPVWWAMAAGAGAAYKRWETSGRALAAAAVLLAAAYGLSRQPPSLLPVWPYDDFDELPVLAARLPPDASVWAYEYGMPAVAKRSFVKNLAHNDDDFYFKGALFVPDYVVMEHGYQKEAREPMRGRVLTFLAREGYRKEAQLRRLILLKHPAVPLPRPDGRPPRLVLPEADAKAAEAFALYLRTVSDPTAALEVLARAAEAGEEDSALLLAELYYFGRGVPADKAKGTRWLQLAADRGSAQAAATLGGINAAEGRLDEGVRWFRRAIEMGSGPAAHDLARLYEEGAGVPRDLTEAARLMKLAAERGVPPAEEWLRKNAGRAP
jgi:TPR repeat protein